jgi:hypothetical protein
LNGLSCVNFKMVSQYCSFPPDTSEQGSEKGLKSSSHAQLLHGSVSAAAKLYWSGRLVSVPTSHLLLHSLSLPLFSSLPLFFYVSHTHTHNIDNEYSLNLSLLLFTYLSLKNLSKYSLYLSLSFTHTRIQF